MKNDILGGLTGNGIDKSIGHVVVGLSSRRHVAEGRSVPVGGRAGWGRLGAVQTKWQKLKDQADELGDALVNCSEGRSITRRTLSLSQGSCGQLEGWSP